MIRVYSANFTSDDYLILARCFRAGLRYLQETGADLEHEKVECALQSASDFCIGKAGELFSEALSKATMSNDKG